MKENVQNVLNELIERYPSLSVCRQDIINAFDILVTAYKNGGKVLTVGNGGSSSDASHIVGELLKTFRKPRPISEDIENKLLSYGEEGKLLAKNLEGALSAICICQETALLTAYANDKYPDGAYAQAVFGLANKEDVLILISTSGNSQPCYLAGVTAKVKGASVIALSGCDGGKLKSIANVSIIVPEKETYKIQELHLPIYHALCSMLEEEFFS